VTGRVAPEPARTSRRRFLGTVGALTATAATASLVGTDLVLGAPAAGAASNPLATVVPFHGEHQAGIVTPAQDRLLFASFDLTTTDRDLVFADLV